MILDLTTPTEELRCESDKRDCEEQAISLCASLLTEAVRQDQEIALTVLGCDNDTSGSLHSGSRHLGKLLSALAMVKLDMQRLPLPLNVIKPSQQTGLCVVRPDHSLPIQSIRDALYFTAIQIPDLMRSYQVEEAG